MKLVLFSVLFSVVSLAGTKLEIPLEGFYFTDHKEVKVNVPKLNQELKKRGLAGLPEVVVVGENPEAFWKVIQKRIRAANEALGREMHFNLYDDGYGEGTLYKMTVCYRGNLTDVPDVIDSMLGNFLDPDQGILAMAAGKKKVIRDEAFKSRAGLKKRFDSEYETNLANIDRWLDYDAKSDTAVVMSDYGPQGDGTELELTEIPPCE